MAQKVEFKTVGEIAEAADKEEEETGLSIIPDSLCMRCGATGVTRMLNTKIPHFREIIICSFECDSCGWTNNEVTFGGEIQEKGCRFVLRVDSAEDLSRQVIKSDTATITIPSIQFEIPANSQRGGVSTVEGVLSRARENLQMYQEERMEHQPEVGAAVAGVIASLVLLSTGADLPFELVVDDPAGNSYVENLCAPAPDPKLSVSYYTRTPHQDLAVGLQISREALAADQLEDTNRAHKLEGETVRGAENLMQRFAGLSTGGGGAAAAQEGGEDGEDGSPELSTELGRREIIRMPTPCPNCGKDGESLTCLADIPHFKEVIIMAFDCSYCNYRSNEIKGGGGVPANGQRCVLRVQSAEDLKRDVLKSATADVVIHELGMEASQASLGGVYTTVEGLLQKVLQTMEESMPYMMGDTVADEHRKSGWGKFLGEFRSYAQGEVFPFTIELRDPLANSFIGGLGAVAPDQDQQLEVTDYKRSWDEDDEFGLHDIKVDDYGEERPETNPNLAMTHKRWGPDHPHESGKGCDDNAPPPAPPSQPETGAVAVAPSIDPEFQPSGSWTGAKGGFVFKMGGQGLGYYRDINRS
uniref:Zinc finger ZPR1-type domain-containing protein n=1 Tax=Rhizochromulina marina TaxID=1034831 RepID=A0A7S2RY09_9STRA